ncbi:MAG TPA: oxygen-independent coproporphyrinogen III oxidase-like protein, partial [Gammaproteobacteria bacterium]|nr:oxygen-independent coproporphyrinogen III oxidase-like protein [Gammaproteobacteria bacterium]
MKLIDPIPVGLYIHLPWCTHKCPYCDFNSHETSGEAPFESYIDALLRDLETETDQLCNRSVDTIFIGGGTPSLFPAVAVQRLLDGVRARVECVDEIEISLEANPGSADSERFAGFNSAGVTRLSIGVQSFRDHQLKRLGRTHNGAAARAALDA